MEQQQQQRKLVFAVNGERFELGSFDPSTTLLEYLRNCTKFKSVKLGCGEGGCGACVVLLSKYDPVLDQVEDIAISSCLTLLISINGCSVTTSEGLGNSRVGFHPIQQRISGFHASQCGFCTPGMCMSLFSALVNSEKTERPDPPVGLSKLTASEAEKAVLGNLCRCTGYRPIVDVCKSFASNVDMEDLGLNSFWGKGVKPDVGQLPLYNRNSISTFPKFLKDEIKSQNHAITIGKHSCTWYSPSSIKELHNLLQSDGESVTKVKLVSGNTSSGIYKDLDRYDRYLDLSRISELLVIKKTAEGVEIGAGVTISKSIAALREEDSPIFSKIAHHMSKVASEFVRNTASLGGNLILAQRNEFPSDIATILLAVDSSVTIFTGSARMTITLEKFLQSPPFDSQTLLLSVYIPKQGPSGCLSKEGNLLSFESYRAAPRPLGNAVAYLNAAFLANISFSSSGHAVLDCIRLAFGAYGTKHATRAREVEEFLIGKSISADVLMEGLKLTKATVIPKVSTSNSSYRTSLAVGFLFKFFLPYLSLPDIPISSGHTNGVKYSDMNQDSLGLSSKQVLETGKTYLPIGDAMKKFAAETQASGEAVYVDDIPSPWDCLHGAFICSKKPLARVKAINFPSSSVSQKVVTVISFKDIPETAQNIGSKTMFGPEPLFADDYTRYAGQPLGFVVAKTQRDANIAAAQAIVHYDIEGLETPILTVEEAVKRSSFFEVPPFICPKPIGDFSEGMAEADHKILSAEIKLGSQYYFYMETQTALAVPDEDRCMVVYSSTQCPENAQTVIAQCLGIPLHNIRVITRRVGGGFGGKALKALPVATACALASYKLCQPVRIYLDRKTDMIMAGGRHPMKIMYSVGFRSDGKITALHVNILINAGMYVDVSPVMPLNIVSALKKYNWGALSFDFKVCRTNLSSKSAMRGPGEVQGSYIAEAIIEHVASYLSKDSDYVRRKNLHTFQSLELFYEGSAGESAEYTLPSVFAKLAITASLEQRTQIVKQFNSCNRWRKRGISRVPIVHEVILRPTPGKVSILNDGSIVVEVGGVELGQGLWTKVKQMTAYALGRVWENGSQTLLDKVRVIQADTLSLIQGGWTSGSTTSESSCEAVRICCEVLVKRLMPLKERLQKEMGALSWDSIIQQAGLEALNLSASTYWVPDYSSMRYLNYGAAVSEVEIDILTGSTILLRTDIIYDCGQSLNPAVDLGQVEGAFLQGLGFFMLEEYITNSEGLVVSDGTWTYKIPTVDTIPRQFNIELLSSGNHQKRVLSSKASGEPPLLLAASVHCATREAIREARKEYISLNCSSESSVFQLDVPATMPVVKKLCGLDNVERYLESLLTDN